MRKNEKISSDLSVEIFLFQDIKSHPTSFLDKCFNKQIKAMREETKILQSIPVDELTGAVSTPIYQTATFVHELPGITKGYDYSRSGNPTRAALEELLAKLEEGHAGFAFASGMAAIDAVLKLLKAGDEIIALSGADDYIATAWMDRLGYHSFCLVPTTVAGTVISEWSGC